MPGGGYFAVVFPKVWEEMERHRMWREEVGRVLAFSYPEQLNFRTCPSTSAITAGSSLVT